MLLLKATSETVQMTTSSSASLDYSVSFVDSPSGLASFSSLEGKVSSAITTTIISAPAASSTRLVKLLTITNRDTSVPVAVSISKAIAGTSYLLFQVSLLLAGEMVQYMDGVGWRYYGANGLRKADQAAGNSVASQVQIATSGQLAGAPSTSTWTQQIGAGSRSWGAITSSADGSKLLVVDSTPGYPYTSNDYGSTWVQQTSTAPRVFQCAASSADGAKLIIGTYGNYLYTSTDSGVTWTEQTSAGGRNWLSVASSANGTKLTAMAYGGSPWTSFDSGTTWTERTGISSFTWSSVAVSADGTQILAGSYGNYLFASSDSGVTWTEQTSAGSRQWYAVALSTDGSKLVAAVSPGYLYTSINSGVTWIQQTSAGSRNWATVASSADGTTLIAADSTPGYVYLSTNYGASWTQQTSAGSSTWVGAALSSDGSRPVGVVGGGYVSTLVSTIGLSYNKYLNELALSGTTPSILLSAVATDPAAPAAGSMHLYAKAVVGKMQLKTQGPSGLDTPLQAAIWQNNFVGWTPSTSTGVWSGTSGVSLITGANALVLPTTTNPYTIMRRSTFANFATTTNQTMGLRTELMFTRGNAAGIGGFMFVCRFGFSSIKTGMRAFVGFGVDTTSMLAVDPSSRLNIVGFGFDLADTAWTFMHNDGTGTATKETIPGQGTLATNDTAYDAYIWCAPNSSTVNYRLDRVDTGVTLVDSSTRTDLPVDTTMLTAQCAMSNGTANVVASDAVLGINRMYIETDR